MSPFLHPKYGDMITFVVECYANSNMLSIVSRTYKHPVIVDIVDCLFPVKIIQDLFVGEESDSGCFSGEYVVYDGCTIHPSGPVIHIWGMASLGTVARGTEKLTDPCGH